MGLRARVRVVVRLWGSRDSREEVRGRRGRTLLRRLQEKVVPLLLQHFASRNGSRLELLVGERGEEIHLHEVAHLHPATRSDVLSREGGEAGMVIRF